MSQERASDGGPAGEVYDWYTRAVELLEGGNPQAAAELLAHARAAVPDSASVLEALARASFDAGRFAAAAEQFADLADSNPDNDYAHFGLGLSRMRLGDHARAIDELAMAAAMRPGRKEYDQALREARATIRFRQQDAGWGG